MNQRLLDNVAKPACLDGRAGGNDAATAETSVRHREGPRPPDRTDRSAAHCSICGVTSGWGADGHRQGSIKPHNLRHAACTQHIGRAKAAINMAACLILYAAMEARPKSAIVATMPPRRFRWSQSRISPPTRVLVIADNARISAAQQAGRYTAAPLLGVFITPTTAAVLQPDAERAHRLRTLEPVLPRLIQDWAGRAPQRMCQHVLERRSC